VQAEIRTDDSYVSQNARRWLKQILPDGMYGILADIIKVPTEELKQPNPKVEDKKGLEDTTVHKEAHDSSTATNPENQIQIQTNKGRGLFQVFDYCVGLES
jgi:hypothetical protein